MTRTLDGSLPVGVPLSWVTRRLTVELIGNPFVGFYGRRGFFPEDTVSDLSYYPESDPSSVLQKKKAEGT